MHKGTVRWFSYSKGCGFISPDDGSADVFVHVSAIRDLAVPALRPNERVSYELGCGPKGPVAYSILVLS